MTRGLFSEAMTANQAFSVAYFPSLYYASKVPVALLQGNLNLHFYATLSEPPYQAYNLTMRQSIKP
jgi:hypothetical protein